MFGAMAPDSLARLPREEEGQPRRSIFPAREEEGRLSKMGTATREEEGCGARHDQPREEEGLFVWCQVALTGQPGIRFPQALRP